MIFENTLVTRDSFFARAAGWGGSLPAVLALAATLAALLPMLALLFHAVFGGADAGAGFWRAVWLSAGETLIFVVLTAVFAAVPGIALAWLCTMRRFAGRDFLTIAAVLPLACPSYLAAYIYDDIFTALGIPLRGVFAAALVSSAVLYPYIFILTRAAFLHQPCHLLTAARILGRGPLRAFFAVALPAARPAVVVGVALVVMDTLNDIALAEYLGVNTLGLMAYDAWLNRGDSALAAQVSAALMMMVFALVFIEERARRRQRHYTVACDRCYACERVQPLTRGGLALALSVGLLPVVAGFILPLVWLLHINSGEWQLALWQGWWRGSAFLLLAAAIPALVAGIFVALDSRRHRRGAGMRLFFRLGQMGYAFPGAVMALGLLLMFGAQGWGLGVFSPLAIGGAGVLTLAYVARFLLIPAGAFEKGFEKISPAADNAARIAGLSFWRIFLRVWLPLLRPAMAAAAALLALETIKELPMVLILRPFDFHTLSTLVYNYASDEALSQAAPAAVLMLMMGGAAAAVFGKVSVDVRPPA